MLNSLLKAGLAVIVTPLAVAADIVTLGGGLVERNEPFTLTSLKSIVENIEDSISPDK